MKKYVISVEDDYPIEKLKEKFIEVIPLDEITNSPATRAKDYGANNKIVTTERYEELKKQIKN
ncbi:MAG TPA: hypothetical protein VEC12_01850 [Bacteroidia bacterium]|nr:hypothetical protein [Bacteroidia bacterium]